MNRIYRSLLTPCFAVVFLAGCGKPNPGTGADGAAAEKKAATKESEDGKVTKAAFDKMIDSWVKRHGGHMGAGFSPKQFRQAMQDWYRENEKELASRKFEQKDFDAMIENLMRAQSGGHGHSH